MFEYTRAEKTTAASLCTYMYMPLCVLGLIILNDVTE